MAEIDINKPGFFHLCIELKNEKKDHDIAELEYWINRQKYFLSILEKHDVPNPQKLAVENTIGVFLYQIPGKKYEAKQYFENLLEENDRSHINTVANLLYIIKDIQKTDCDEDGDDYNHLISSLESKLEDQDQLSEARALCERGYFYDYQYDEHIQNLSQSKIARTFFEAGIEKGSEQGMSQTELCVWKFYLLDTNRKVFSFVCPGEGGIEEELTSCFKKIVESFESFYMASGEESVFYKSRAIVDTMLHLTIHEEFSTKLRNFASECENSIMGDLWEDRFSSLEEAFNMSTFDYHIPARIAKVYCRLDKYDEALKYTEISLSIEKKTCGSAYNTRMIAYTSMAKKYELEEKRKDLAEGCLKKAFEEGKNIEKVFMTEAAAVNMARICYHLAVDKSKGWWTVPKENNGYLNEAITYNQKAIKMSHGSQVPRAERQLSDCYWVGNRFEESLIHLRKALQSCEPKMCNYNNKCLLDRYCRFMGNRNTPEEAKIRAIAHITEDIEFVWVKTNHDGETDVDFKDAVIHFTKRMGKQERYLKAILNEFAQKKSASGRQTFNVVCQIIQECPEMPSWLQEHTCKYF